jgi:hypothetical protein
MQYQCTENSFKLHNRCHIVSLLENERPRGCISTPGPGPQERMTTVDPRSLAHPGYEKLHQEHLKAVRAFEDEHGRPMLPSELDRFSREFYAHCYRADLRHLAVLGVADEEDP